MEPSTLLGVLLLCVAVVLCVDVVVSHRDRRHRKSRDKEDDRP